MMQLKKQVMGLAAAATTWAATALGAEPKPNIVLILSDDVGVGCVNAYGADPKLVRTPNIDRLAAEGRLFTDACTPSSVCTPTRYGVLTGRYCWRTSLKHGTLKGDGLLIEPGRLTMASLLKQQGYRTAAIGKWHLGFGAGVSAKLTGELKPGPLEVGFDYYFGVPSNHADSTGVYVENRGVWGLRSDKLEPMGKCYYGGKPFIGLDAPQRKDEEVMTVLTDKVVDWLGQQENGKPFFLYYTPVTTHEPATPSQATRGTSQAGPFGDWIHEMDRSVGRVMAALEQKKLADNTLVIFTSDNGGAVFKEGERLEARAYAAGLRLNGHFRERKHSIYEGGFRVPFIARWPGKVPAGTRCDEMVNLVDLLATTAAAVGEKLPEASQAAEDSYNILPALLGQGGGSPSRTDMVQHSSAGVFAIRQGPWKYIEGKCHPDMQEKAAKFSAPELRPQLYNLQDDPSEQHDVLEQHPELGQRLAGLLEQHRQANHTRAAAPTPEPARN